VAQRQQCDPEALWKGHLAPIRENYIW